MHNQKLNYLRIRLNNECNFHCLHCQPFPNRSLSDDEGMLSIEEIAKLVDGLARLGVEHVRIIGGEPLLREDIFDFIYIISSTKRLKQISLTTNGFYLEDKALALKGAGLNRINIYLSSLDERKFKKITGVDGLAKVLEGICVANEAELTPIRINAVLLKGLNFDEIEDFAALSTLYPLDVRFIEYIPNSKNLAHLRSLYVPGYVVKNNIEFAFGPLILDKINTNEGPATYYRIKDAKGRIGFINSVTEFFCVNCNTSILHNDGKLFPCFYSSSYIDLRQPLRNFEFKLLADKMRDCFKIKPQVTKGESAENIGKYSPYIENLN